jgi:transposase-like protein
MVDRQTGRLRSVVLDNVTANNVTNVLGANVAQDTRLLTDSSNVYRRMGAALAGHEAVNHSVGEYVRQSDVTVHTNTVEGTFSIFKRGMRGIYQHCSRKHLHRYLAEFDFRYSNRIAVGVDDKARADNALQGVRGKRLTYETVSRRWPAAEVRIVW